MDGRMVKSGHCPFRLRLLGTVHHGSFVGRIGAAGRSAPGYYQEIQDRCGSKFTPPRRRDRRPEPGRSPHDFADGLPYSQVVSSEIGVTRMDNGAVRAERVSIAVAPAISHRRLAVSALPGSVWPDNGVFNSQRVKSLLWLSRSNGLKRVLEAIP